MKAILYARFGKYPKDIEELVKHTGLDIINPSTEFTPNAVDGLKMATPDIVVTLGGDGTLLGAEHSFPGIPKLPLRDSATCHVCTPLPPEKTLELFSQNKLVLKNFLKLEATFAGKKHQVLNEVCVRNALVNSALRFNLTTSHSPLAPSPLGLIGDGLLVATPFGSTGYFYSITRKSFTSGVGIALNNLINFDPREIILPETVTVTITITRGPGQMSFDNDPEIVSLKDGDTVTIKKSPQPAKIYTLPGFTPSQKMDSPKLT